MTKPITGENHAWERIGPMEAELRGATIYPDAGTAPGTLASLQSPTPSRIATPIADAVWTKRISLVNAYHIGTTTEQEDPTKMIIDPNSQLTIAMAAGMKRKQDDIIIAAATGDALDQAGVLNPLPAGQKINHTGQPISVDLMTEIQTKFMDNNIDPDVQKFAIVPPSAVATLMKLAEHTSNDFVQANVLQQYGVVRNWMGFDWIISNRRLYTWMSLGVVRIEDEHLVEATFKR